MVREILKTTGDTLSSAFTKGITPKCRSVDPVTGIEVSIVEYILVKNLERPSKGGFKFEH